MHAPKLATVEENFWQLRSAEESHRESPENFWIPDFAIRQNLKRGDAAKLIFDFEGYNEDGGLEIGGERMWVIVKEKLADFYLGVLDNQPAGIDEGFLDKNSEVYFKAEHIIDVGYPPRDFLEERFGKDFLSDE